MNEGLSSKEAQDRLEKHGKNEMKRTEKVHPIKILISQFTSPLILILIAAIIISIGLNYLPGTESGFVDTILIFKI